MLCGNLLVEWTVSFLAHLNSAQMRIYCASIQQMPFYLIDCTLITTNKQAISTMILVPTGLGYSHFMPAEVSLGGTRVSKRGGQEEGGGGQC